MKLLVSLIILILISNSIFADNNLPETQDSTKHDLETWRIITTSAFSAGALYYSGTRFKEAWGASDRSSWHWKTNDFQGDGFLQNDEYSHFVAGQRVTQLAGGLARWTGFNDKTSLIIGSSISFGIAVWVEILDAYNPGQGFGTSDLIFGTAGIAFEIARQKYPSVKKFDLRVSFKRFQDISPNLIVAQNALHYDNTIYWLTYQADENIPFDIGLGYSTSREPDPVHWLLPKRELYLGIGISGKELIRLFNRDISDYISGIGDWYEFTIYAKIYESEPINVFD
ncbi:MAG: DUF2279 domain-containing protein [Candidatus Zixiibacteriota bacterium]